MSKRCLVIVVVEDELHEMLVRRYLKKRVKDKHEMRFQRSPSGRGSADRWVRDTFVKEVNVYRKRHAQTKLIVVIDADIYTVQQRLTQLDQALTGGGKAAVDVRTEQIARLVPKRNVETWILCLHAEVVDEATDYKGTRNDWNDLIPQASEALFEWTRSNAVLPHHCTDSLRIGVDELRRTRF